MVMLQNTVAVSHHSDCLDSEFSRPSESLGPSAAEQPHPSERQQRAFTLLMEWLYVGFSAGVFGALSDAEGSPSVSLSMASLKTAFGAVSRHLETVVESPITARERCVLRLIAQGLSEKKIARDLAISPETVKSHTKHIFAKLGTNTRAQAVACAAKRGLL